MNFISGKLLVLGKMDFQYGTEWMILCEYLYSSNNKHGFRDRLVGVVLK